ncbi:PadR family transcriptional regulator [Nonomuraea polychroma]|uniref:PadR family transcriptional regulator n=1 Tax=Nonomuraea polychroma TaxID=46176 RepID=A0A438M6T7_9ACTN|nr:helix-turn-helix transcriptional regulator [Nonomuraea polychroma]RVX41420.1 PadR family transcriptional regulator [Nonomuraea polychroma]
MSRRSLQEPTFLILTALAAGPQHGYGIITDVVQISGERVRLQAGTLYAALDRLQGEGLVATDREEVVDGRARRYYRLTSEGEARLATEAEHLRRNADTATSRLRTRLRPAFSIKPAASREAGLAMVFRSAT